MDQHEFARLRCEVAEPLPQPDATELRASGSQALDWLIHHSSTLADQAIGLTATRSMMEALLREPAPEVGAGFPQVLEEFAQKVAPYAFRTNHPRFLAFVPGAPTFLSVLGELLCAGVNFFAGVWLEAAGPSEVELVVLDWFKEFLRYPPEAAGLLTSGGSEANLTALVVARQRLSSPDRERAILYASEHRHWSVDRAARIMGLRPDQLRPLPVDESFRLQPSVFAQAVAEDRARGGHPWLLVANAGTTNTGTVDPLAELAAACRLEQVWLHVDAAYGWSAVLDATERPGLAGIERADSLTLDPHKWFGQTFEAGCILVRDGALLPQAFAQHPEYLQDVGAGEDEVNFADRGLALTRRFRALKIWLSLKVLGVAWFRRLIRHCCLLADLGEELLVRAGTFEILSKRQLSIVCFRFAPQVMPGRTRHRPEDLDLLNLELVEELRRTGRAFISSTRLHGRVALRFCFVNWRTRAADVEEVVALLSRLGAQLAASDARRG
jgi:aromatic-L-amino-acid/L-tryptophan decarboxylase